MAVETLERYTVEEAIGQGQYGRVSLAFDKLTGSKVAVKRIRTTPGESTLVVKEPDGDRHVPASVAIEIKILRLLHHDHIVKLLDVVYHPHEIFLVFEYLEHDLCGLIGLKPLTQPQIKCYLSQLLHAMVYCHVNGILHRDIKSANLLVNNKGVLKVADFGMAVALPKHPASMPCGVVTRWYRPPELLMGFSNYGTAVDVWSAGCVLAELLVRKAILAGKDDADQLYWIFRLCGAPDETTWPGVSKSVEYQKFLANHQKRPAELRMVLKHIDPEALNLLERMLEPNPAKRITAKDALLSDYLWSDPLPCQPSELPSQVQPCNELNARRKRERRMVEQQRQEAEVKKRKEVGGCMRLSNGPVKTNGLRKPVNMH